MERKFLSNHFSTKKEDIALQLVGMVILQLKEVLFRILA